MSGAQGIAGTPDTELIAICDIDPKREKAFRDEGYEAPFYTDYKQKVFSGTHKAEEIDLVKKLTPKARASKGKSDKSAVASDHTALSAQGHQEQIQDMAEAVLKNKWTREEAVGQLKNLHSSWRSGGNIGLLNHLVQRGLTPPTLCRKFLISLTTFTIQTKFYFYNITI